jgi:hypothetical protein
MINFQERLLFIIIQEFIYYLANIERIYIQRELDERIYLQQLIDNEIYNIQEEIYDLMYENNEF